MITPMKHVTILFAANRRRRTLMRLRSLGLIHIEKKQESSVEISSKIHLRFTTCRDALQILKQYRIPKHAQAQRMILQNSNTTGRAVQARGILPGEEIAKKVMGLVRRKEFLQDEEQRIAHYIVDLRAWGAFKWKEIEFLQSKGFYCHFYTMRKKYFLHNAPPNAMVISRQLGKIHFVIVSRTEENELPYEEIMLPMHDLDSLYRRQQKIVQEIAELESHIAECAYSIAAVKLSYHRLHQLNQVITARDSFHWAGDVVYLRGFIPVSYMRDLKKNAAQMGWGLFIRDPFAEEEPPTLISNPKSIAIINPLYRLLGTLPGYREPEISVPFLLFFVVFFAMIVGDAGYALLLIGCALCYRIYARSTLNIQGASLLLVVGIATLTWGTLSGNWFGAQEIGRHPFFSRLIIPRLNAFDTRSIPFVQWICFIIATVHISIAHIWRTIYEWKHDYWLKACVNIGWIFLVLGLYSLVVRLILGPFGFWYMEDISPFLIAGIVGIVIFEKQERGKSFFIGVVKGIISLFNTMLNGISSFADIISYLRLFAVGLASVEIARSFNEIAANINGGAFSVIVSVLLLIIGHSLNIAMGALSIIVHGVRLNMLEFSGHLGIEWHGTPFQPFAEEKAYR